MSSSSQVPDDWPPPPRLATVGWAVRRAALGLLILMVMVVLGAWLFYASIDMDEAAAASSPAGIGSAPAPQR